MNIQAVAMEVVVRFRARGSIESFNDAHSRCMGICASVKEFRGKKSSDDYELRNSFDGEVWVAVLNRAGFNWTLDDRAQISGLFVAFRTVFWDLEGQVKIVSGKDFSEASPGEVGAALNILLDSDRYQLNNDDRAIATAVLDYFGLLVLGGELDGVLGVFSAQSSTSQAVAWAWMNLASSVLGGLKTLRIKAGGPALLHTVEGRIEAISMTYYLEVEELEFDVACPAQTFAQAFQEFLFDYSSRQPRTHVLNNGAVLIRATLCNEGVDESHYYKNGGPLQYRSLGNLITI